MLNPNNYNIKLVAGVSAVIVLSVWLLFQLNRDPIDFFIPPPHEVLVVNYSGNSIVGFEIRPDGSVADIPSRVIFGANTGLATPRDITVDSHGNIYVINMGLINFPNPTPPSPSPSITIYSKNAHGNVFPTRSISSPLLHRPQGIAVRDQGGGGQSIWVSNLERDNRTSSIIQFPLSENSPFEPLPLFSLGNLMLSDVVHRPPSSYLFALMPKQNGIVVLRADAGLPFPGPNGQIGQPPTPTSTFRGTTTELNNPYSAAVDSTGNLYVLNNNPDLPEHELRPKINIYNSKSLDLDSETIVAPVPSGGFWGPTYRMSNPTGIAVSPGGGRIFVADGSQLLVFNRNPAGSNYIFGQQIISTELPPSSSRPRIINSLDTAVEVAVRCSPPGCPGQ